MAHALELVASCEILKSHPVLTFQEGRFHFRIDRHSTQSIYTVTDGQRTFSVPVRWAFGLGSAGQTYVYDVNGSVFESRVSFYSALNGLDFTMGDEKIKPRTVEEAAGRPMFDREARQCFNCHSTSSVAGDSLRLDTMTPGLQCVRCHEGADRHAAALASKTATGSEVRHLTKLSAEQVSDFCGQCHRTWQQVSLSGTLGVNNVRFQPYRLTNSKCYDGADRRIACVACHDPHREVVHQASWYDGKCKACHASGGHPSAAVCKVAKQDCVTCHMPRIDLPGAHNKFTDHQIRIVRNSDPYPN